MGTGQVKLLVLLTKSDKLNRRDAQAALEQAQQELSVLAGEHADIGVTLFSALSGLGVADVAQALRDWVPAATASATAAPDPQPG